MTNHEGLTGSVFNIQRYSLHDGPGIRTTVFLSGCPLSCRWCSNPESKSISGALMHNAKTCLRCGRCVESCPHGAITMAADGPELDRLACDLCGLCADNCPPHALKITARTMSVGEVIEEVKNDRPFYRRSGGGMTLSGGEPLLQGEFAAELLRAARKAAINTAVETCGYVPWRNLECAIPYLDYLLYDVKHIDSAKHQLYTGVSTQTILENLKRAAPLATHVIVRVPVIPGFNDTAEEIRAIANYTAGLEGIAALHLLPYHRHGQAKYEQLNRTYELEGISPLTAEREEELAAIVRETGLECRIRG